MLWLEDATYTQATFFGTPGHTYHFCSQGVDNAGNKENCPPGCDGAKCNWPIQSDAHIGVTPWSRVDDLPPYTAQTEFEVSWSGSPDVESYDVQVRVGEYGDWKDWLTDVPDTSAQYEGAYGNIYYFRSRGRFEETWEVYPYDYDTYTSAPRNSVG